MRAQIQRVAVLLLLALIPGYFLAQAELLGFAAGSGDAQGAGNATLADSLVQQSFPFARQLEQLGLDLRLLGGQREQNGIFISEDRLMRNIDAPIESNVERNIAEVAIFSQRLTASSSGKKSTYLAILPTAAGVQQQSLPRYAEAGMPVNQQRQIEEVYNRISTIVRTVDVYSALYNRRDQYIYYRTDNNLTALGGYYTYSAIAGRMEISNRSLSQFNIEYVDHAYYGNLYQPQPGTVGDWGKSTAPYRLVQPDTISLYHYTAAREYTVTKRGGGNARNRTYHTLYPRHLMELGSAQDIYLGGSAAITEIRSSAPGRRQLLVFGDSTAAAWLPFLANHYQQITFVNFLYAWNADYGEIRPEQYDQVLFAYGIETFIHTKEPAQASKVVWSDDL